jgi:ribosomal protein L11 methyltransferase
LAICSRNERRKTTDAIDIDNWCYLNSIENAERNNQTATVCEGDASFTI